MNGFYNTVMPFATLTMPVVIPLRMNGFYNHVGGNNVPLVGGCHTAPNERLLQLNPKPIQRRHRVVIPLRMNGFYNNDEIATWTTT